MRSGSGIASGIWPEAAPGEIGDRNFPGEIEELVRENPWKLSCVPGVGFQTCEDIARTVGLSADHPRRLQYGVVAIMDRAERREGIPDWMPSSCWPRQRIFLSCLRSSAARSRARPGGRRHRDLRDHVQDLSPQNAVAGRNWHGRSRASLTRMRGFATPEEAEAAIRPPSGGRITSIGKRPVPGCRTGVVEWAFCDRHWSRHRQINGPGRHRSCGALHEGMDEDGVIAIGAPTRRRKSAFRRQQRPPGEDHSSNAGVQPPGWWVPARSATTR